MEDAARAAASHRDRVGVSFGEQSAVLGWPARSMPTMKPGAEPPQLPAATASGQLSVEGGARALKSALPSTALVDSGREVPLLRARWVVGSSLLAVTAACGGDDTSGQGGGSPTGGSAGSGASSPTTAGGANNHGQLGDGTLTDAVDISVAGVGSGSCDCCGTMALSCALLVDSTVSCWGGHEPAGSYFCPSYSHPGPVPHRSHPTLCVRRGVAAPSIVPLMRVQPAGEPGTDQQSWSQSSISSWSVGPVPGS